MSENTPRETKLEIIYLLVDAGYQILTLEDRIYWVTQWTEAGDETEKHSLMGRDITNALKPYPDFNRMPEAKIKQMIEKTSKSPKVRLNFSKNFRWKLYLPPTR